LQYKRSLSSTPRQHWNLRQQRTSQRSADLRRVIAEVWRAARRNLHAHRHGFVDFLLRLHTTTMAGHAALAAGRTGFITRPLVRRTFFMRGFAALAGNLALLVTIHRSETAIFLTHDDLQCARRL